MRRRLGVLRLRTSATNLLESTTSKIGLLLTLLTLATCTPASPPIELEVSITSEPKAGATIRYRASLTAVGQDVPNISMQVEMPQAVEVISGSPHWEGDLAADQTTELYLELRVNQPGQWLIQTNVLAKPNSESSATYGASNQTLLISEQDAGRVLSEDELLKTKLPCGPDLSCGSPPALSTKPLVTLTPSP